MSNCGWSLFMLAQTEELAQPHFRDDTTLDSTSMKLGMKKKAKRRSIRLFCIFKWHNIVISWEINLLKYYILWDGILLSVIYLHLLEASLPDLLGGLAAHGRIPAFPNFRAYG